MSEKELYKNKQWLVSQLLEEEKSFKQIAEETGYTIHQLHDWAQKKFHLDAKKIKWNIGLSEEQRQVVLGGLLGDGHITPLGRYTESHSESEKEYLEWKMQKLRSLFPKNYTVYIKQQAKDMVIRGVACHAQNQYALATLCNKELQSLRELSRIDIIHQLDELGFAVYCLDDGCNHFRQGVRKSASYWTLGACDFAPTEAQTLLDIIQERFGIEGSWEYVKDRERSYISIRFNTANSKLINNLIIRNIPENIDIIRKKVR